MRYRGYYFDAETGFYYLQSRYYDPALGRFLNADSFASTGQGFLGYNMFAYCKNTPISMTDNGGCRPVYEYDIESENSYNPISNTGDIDRGNTSSAPNNYRTYNSQAESRNNNCYSYAFCLPCIMNPGELAAVFGKNPQLRRMQFVNVYNKRHFTVGEIAGLVMADMEAIHRDCRIITSPQDANPGETVVALKTGTYIFTEQMTDYHFAVLLSDGTWADKPGITPVRRNAISGYDMSWPLSGVSRYYYSSATVFFAYGG